MELHQRMGLDKFPSNMGVLHNVSAAINNYIDFGQKLSSGASTSLFNLIQESLEQFLNMVKKDFRTVFG